MAELRILTPTAPLPQAGDLGALLGEVRQVAAAPAPGGALVAAAEALATREQRLAEFEHRLAAGFPEGEIEVQRIPSVDGSESFESFGFRIAVPLAFSRSVAEKRAAAEARTEAARWRLEATRRDFEQRARAAHAALEVHEASLADLAPLLAQLPRTERSLAEQFRLGAISYLVYLDGLGRLDQLRLDLARTRSEAALARFELATLTADATIFPLAESAKAHSSALSPDASATETTP